MNDLVTSSDNRLAHDVATVKKSSSVSEEMDAEYLEAVEQGDMKTAQRMVDAAAQKAGYTVRAYHGTPNGTFYEFKDWQYFTEDASYAGVYQKQGASVNFKKTANKPKTYDVLHTINGRQKIAAERTQSPRGGNPSTTATISLSEFLSVVNTTHQSILSKNVLDVFEEQKNEKGYYAGRVKFSTEEDTEAAEQAGEPAQLMNNSKLYMPTAARFRKLTALLSVIS